MKNSKNTKKTINRRKFLGDCGKMTSIPVASSMLNLSMMDKIMAARAPGSIDDHKAIVNIFMHGGNDSYNMLVPTDSGRYSGYAKHRGGAKIGLNALHKLTNKEGQVACGVHPNMAKVANMFNNGDLSFIANVGPLVEPVPTRADWRRARKPFGIGSHHDSRMVWQTSYGISKSGTNARTGWAGRMLDVLNDSANNEATITGAIGGGTFLRGVKTKSHPLGGLAPIAAYKSNTTFKEMYDATMEISYGHVLQAHYNYSRKNTIETADALKELTSGVVFQTPFPGGSLGNKLKECAKYIAVADKLGHKRQAFFCSYGMFDLHKGSNTLLSHANLMNQLSEALFAFNEAMKEIGKHDNVITFTASDFSRTLNSNGGGTDHAYGANHLVMGGPIQGGDILGTYPNLAKGAGRDIGRGRQIPSTSTDEYFATIAKWYGITNTEMEIVLPGIKNWPNGGIIEGMIDGVHAPFIPDPNKTYYIEAPYNKRLSASPTDGRLKSQSNVKAGVYVQWKFVPGTIPGRWYIERADGGNTPRVQSNGATIPALVASANGEGENAQFEITAQSEGKYFLTIPGASSQYTRLRVTSRGVVNLVTTAHGPTQTAFSFTEVV